MSSSTPQDTAHGAPHRALARRAAFASFMGAVVDWYDFFLYGIVAGLLFGDLFFPDASPAVGTLAAWATFGVGFLFRPLGGIVFGHFGDRLGRKRMLVLTMLIMGVASTLIGVLPTYAQAGIWAPVLLVLLRATQGFAVGGEWGGAALMAVENAPRKWRSLYSSGVQVGASFGLLLATLVTKLMSSGTSEAAFRAWGWRIPFLFSAFLVLVGLVIRAKVEESPVFTEKVAGMPEGARPRVPLVAAVRSNPGGFFAIIGLRFVELFTFYGVTTFGLSYGTDELGLDRDSLLDVNLAVGGLAVVTIPAFAYLADRYGRRRIYVAGGLVGAASAVPYFWAMESGSMVLIVVCAVVLVNIGHDMAVSVQQSLFTDMFGAEYRYSGAGVGYQLASAVGGGFTPLIAGVLVIWAGGGWSLVAGYVAVGCLVSAVVAWRMRGAEEGVPSGAPRVELAVERNK
ncbi:shikimate transporter [Streptomyces acidiscabies]|uniref:Putative proline/betaine transporter n=1 Tax=Streptomyces acidiscabies TaxID=42234 RepID=A0AAP6BLX0_9ACTN|nr:shikimate transporter [Streptomyces acidiscabies]MBZ3917366.1 shikimate transporter [Streptomyces acidiscabies]MDX2967214.1 shikimate transporter [Streptomyces acidiscabies]MDX3025818.1 shikimate transporter [Streptomyces acidiscabies]MDX3796965.1 shikimate transporter [Streptomyces acidiscabies]